MNLYHSARRPRTLSGRPTLGPYESFPDVEKKLHRRHVRIGRYNYVLRMPGRKRTSGTFIRAQSRSSYQRHLRMRRTVNDPCRVGIFRFTFREPAKKHSVNISMNIPFYYSYIRLPMRKLSIYTKPFFDKF